MILLLSVKQVLYSSRPSNWGHTGGSQDRRLLLFLHFHLGCDTCCLDLFRERGSNHPLPRPLTVVSIDFSSLTDQSRLLLTSSPPPSRENPS